MTGPPAGARIRLCAGVTDMRRGFTGLSAQVQQQLGQDPFGGRLFVFRGRRGDRIKVPWWDGDGLCLFAKRLERGRFAWPRAEDGAVLLRRGKRAGSRPGAGSAQAGAARAAAGAAARDRRP